MFADALIGKNLEVSDRGPVDVLLPEGREENLGKPESIKPVFR